MSHEPMNVTCMDCAGPYAQPVFTAPLSSIQPNNRKSRQPKWYCDKCRPHHHRVSPTTGHRVVAVHGLHRERIVTRKGVTVSGQTGS